MLDRRGGGDWNFPDYIKNNTAQIYGLPPNGTGNGYFVASGMNNNLHPYIWNIEVQKRMKECLEALHDHLVATNRYDVVEAINMCESAKAGASCSDGVWGDAIVANMQNMKSEFPEVWAFQYANFPQSQQVKYADAFRNSGIGWGGPDVAGWFDSPLGENEPDERSLKGDSGAPGTYAYYCNYWGWSNVTSHVIGDKQIKGAAVQNADYDWSDVGTYNYDLALNRLKLNYLFWQAQPNSAHNTSIINFVASKVGNNGVTGGLNTIPPGPPGDVTNLNADAGSGEIDFTWSNPSDSDYNGVEICRSTIGWPAQGQGVVHTTTKTATSWTDSGLTNGTTYYYMFYAKDSGAPICYAAGTGVAETPVSSTTVPFTSEATYDGWALELSEFVDDGGSCSATGTGNSGVLVGDTFDRKQYKGILSFDTSSLPDGAVIDSATLKMLRGTSNGTPTSLGTIRVDVKSYSFNGDATLENADFDAGATATQVATMSYPSNNGTWSTGTLNQAGRDAIVKTSGRTQFRVYFSTDDDNDSTGDNLGFYPGDNGTPGNRPVLEVTYH